MCWVSISSKENPTEHSNTEILIQFTGIVSPTFSSQKCLRIMVLNFLHNHVGIAKDFDQYKETLLSLQIWNSFHQTWSPKIYWKNKEWGKRQAISTLCALFLKWPIFFLQQQSLTSTFNLLHLFSACHTKVKHKGEGIAEIGPWACPWLVHQYVAPHFGNALTLVLYFV